MESLTRAAVIRVYRWYAPVYDMLFGRVLEAGRIELANKINCNSPARLLEVGVGTGLSLLHTSAEKFTCGIDISFDMLKRAKSALNNKHLENSVLLCADAEQLPFPDDSFDCITLPYVLSVTPNPQRLLDEIRRVCTPGGQILILNHFQGAGVWQVAERIVAPVADHVGFRSTMKMDTLSNPQWQIVSVCSVNLFGLSKLVELRNTHE